MRRGRALLLVGLAAALGGCQPAADADQIRLCRVALVGLVALATPDAEVVVTRQALLPTPAGDVSVRVAALGRTMAGRDQSHLLECRFRRDGGAAPDALLGARFDHVPLSGIALWALRRFWLATAEGGMADPLPVDLWGAAPAVPPAVAHGLQSAVSALPGLATYGLMATAYALVYGLVGRINLAFGALGAVGGAASLAGLGLVGGTTVTGMVATALAAALWAGAMHGAVLARTVFMPLGRATGQQGLIATIGLALVLEEYVRIAQGPTPAWVTPLRTVPIGLARADAFTVTVTPLALVVTAAFATASAALLVLMRRSQFGRNWRAMADDPAAAALLGVDPARLFTLTFVLAAALAGAAGAVTVLIYGSFGRGFGTVLGLKALLAAVLGGIGSVPGALLGALAIAATETLWSVWCPIEYRDLALYVLLSAVMVARPGGILGFRELAPRLV